MIRLLSTKSKAGLITSIFSLRSSQTSLLGRFSRTILFVSFREIPQEYVGILWSFAISQKVDEPILFAKPFFEYASAPSRNRSHFLIA